MELVDAGTGLDSGWGVVPGDAQRALQLPRLMAAGQSGQLLGETLPLRALQKGRRLNGVHQQLQLSRIKLAAGEKPAGSVSLAVFDVQSGQVQHLQIGIDAFALGADALLLQPGDQFRHADRMLFVAVAAEDLEKPEQLQLLIWIF